MSRIILVRRVRFGTDHGHVTGCGLPRLSGAAQRPASVTSMADAWLEGIGNDVLLFASGVCLLVVALLAWFEQRQRRPPPLQPAEATEVSSEQQTRAWSFSARQSNLRQRHHGDGTEQTEARQDHAAAEVGSRANSPPTPPVNDGAERSAADTPIQVKIKRGEQDIMIRLLPTTTLAELKR